MDNFHIFIDKISVFCYYIKVFPLLVDFFNGVFAEHISQFMTKFFLKKEIFRNIFLKTSYKLFIITYSFYMAFSSQAFALFEDSGTSLINDEPTIGIINDYRVDKIKFFFNRYDLPLAKYAELFVISADRYDIDWRLVAAISFIESTGGKFACKKVDNNAFGWGSCAIGFNSYEEAIDHISMNLAGKYPRTAKHYANKDVRGILEAYNPPSVVPDYADKVIRQMEIIDNQ